MWLSQRKDGTFLIIFEFKFTGADVERGLEKILISTCCATNKTDVR